MSISTAILGVPGPRDGGGTVAQRVNDYLDSLGGWTYDARFNESSGDLLSYGTDSSATGTNTNVDQEQVGQLGAKESYNYNGSTSTTQVANANLSNSKALTTQRGLVLFYIDSAANHMIFSYGVGGAVGQHYVDVNSVGRFEAGVRLTVSDAMARSNAGKIATDKWYLAGWDYDDADSLGLGRKTRLFIGDAETSMTLSIGGGQNTGNGTVETPAGDLGIGAYGDTPSNFLDGRLDLLRIGNNLWSPAGTPSDITALEAARVLVFP